jgi:hypothetical protein
VSPITSSAPKLSCSLIASSDLFIFLEGVCLLIVLNSAVIP